MSRTIIEIRIGNQYGPVTSFISQINVKQLNPFVLWDHFQTEGLKGTTGFDFHGHSGIATITYPVIGDVVHEDTDGNEGKLEAGGMQLMASGAGVLHKETVYPDQGVTDAFQLWTLVPQHEAEMGPVTYSLVEKEKAPIVVTSDSETKVLIGQHSDKISPAKHSVDITYLEINITPNGSWEHTVTKGQSTGFLYVRSGEVVLNNTELKVKQLGVLDQSDADLSLTAGNSGAVIMVALGQPLDQPIISSGPSIHSSQQRLKVGTQNIKRLTESLYEKSHGILNFD